MAKKIDHSTVLAADFVTGILAKYEEMQNKLLAKHAELIKQLESKQGRVQNAILGSGSVKDQKAVSELITSVKSLNGEITKLGSKIRALDTAKKVTNTTTNKLTTDEKELLKVTQQLAIANARLSKDYIAQAAALKATNKVVNQRIIDEQKLMGIYKQSDGYFQRVIKNVVAYGAAWFGLQSIIGIIKDIFNTTKQLEQVSFGLKSIIKDNNELGQTQSFLISIARNYGVELVKLTDNYVKFRATLGQTNIKLFETQRIFETIVKTGAVLGLSNERIELALLAIQQMASKSVVSLEELKRQLAEQIPGSVGIMAAAFKKTIPEFYKMISAGKILADEALPKFREELEKVFDLNSINNINTMTVALGKLSTEWQLMVQSFSASGFAKGFINFLTGELEAIRYLIQGEVDFYKSTLDFAKQANEELVTTKDLFKESINADPVGFWRQRVTQSQEALNSYNQELGDLQSKLDELELTPAVSVLGGIEAEKNLQTQRDIIKSKIAQIEYEKTYLTFLKEEYRTVLKTSEAFDESGYLDRLNIQLDNLRKELRDLSEINPSTGLKDMAFYYKEADSINGKILKKQEEIDRILGKQKKKVEEIIKLNKDDLIPDKEDELKAVDLLYNPSKDSLIELNKKLSDLQRKQFNDDLEERASYYDEVDDLLVGLGVKQDGEYKKQVELLKKANKDKLIEDKDYYKARISLWVENNQFMIDSLKDLTDQVANMFLTILDGDIEAAQRDIDASNERLNTIESNLDKERKLKEEGLANDYDLLVAQKEKEEEVRQKAFEQYKAIKKKEAQIELAAQINALGLATAETFAANAGAGPYGIIVAIASIASMIAAFASYQNKIKSISNENVEKFAEGGLVKGKSHAQGGKKIEVEGNEWITKAKATSKSRKLLEAINDERIDDKLFYKLNMPRIPGMSTQRDNLYLLQRELIKNNTTATDTLNFMKNKIDIVPLPTGGYYEVKQNSVRKVNG